MSYNVGIEVLDRKVTQFVSLPTVEGLPADRYVNVHAAGHDEATVYLSDLHVGWVHVFTATKADAGLWASWWCSYAI